MARPKKLQPPVGSQAQTRITSADSWLAQQARQDLLRFLICGSIGDGKSTLINRLLWESPHIFDVQTRPHLDVAYHFFSTPRRKFIAAEVPGDEQCTRSLVTSASTADVAVLVLNATQGLLASARRYAYVISLIGVKHIILAINKMDLVAYKPEVFKALCQSFDTFAQPLGFESIRSIALSALKGDNLTSCSRYTPWYQGPSLIGALEMISTAGQRYEGDHKLVFPVQWVNHSNTDFQGLSGSVAAGQLALGDKIKVTASGQIASIARIITWDGDQKKACNGDALTIVLDRDVQATPGDVLSHADQPLDMTDQFEATLVWMHHEPGLIGRAYKLKLANQWTDAAITAIKYRVDTHTQAHESCRQLTCNDAAVCNLALSHPLVFDQYKSSKILGGFILIDKFSHTTIAAGMIHHNLRRAQNVHKQALSITRSNRERLNGHQGKIIWFTGLSGSGKSTLANALEKELHAQGKRTYILDGDNIRQGLNRDLGFTDADRVENIRRVAEVAKLMMDAGLIVMTAFISPFRAERDMARQLIGKENFIEVFVDTPLHICEQRDPKGLYKKARAGDIPNMTGINSPYEAPTCPDMTMRPDTSIEALMKLIE